MIKYTECIVRMWGDDFTFSASLVDDSTREEPYLFYVGKETISNLESYYGYGEKYLMEVTGPGINLVGEFTLNRHSNESFGLRSA